MTRWDFELIVEGRDLCEDDAFAALCRASASTNDDIYPAWRADVQYAGFLRDADCLEDAVLSAVRQVESIGGVKVAGVSDASLVTLGQIAARSGRDEASLKELITGVSGPGGFPDSVPDPDDESPVWIWEEAVEWFHTALSEQLHDPNAAVFAALSDTLRARASCNQLDHDQRQRIAALLTG